MLTSHPSGSPRQWRLAPPWPNRLRAGRPRLTSCSGSGAAVPGKRARLARGRLKRMFKAEAASPASVLVCDWLAPHVPSAFSHDSPFDPRSFRGHSLHLGHVFDSGGRALDRRIVFCTKCGAMFWERADALCRSCKQHPGGCASQLRKLRVGFFLNKRYPGWTVELVRRPTLEEANTLVAQLESCEAGLGRAVLGADDPPKKTRVAPQAAELLHWQQDAGTAKTADTDLRRWDAAHDGYIAAFGINAQLVEKLAAKAGSASHTRLS